jgi:hypothetical protein
VDQLCDPESKEVIYVGNGAEDPGSETGSDSFFPDRLPTKVCLFISRPDGDVLVAERIYTPPFRLRAAARTPQRLKAPGASRFNNLVMTLRCTQRCTVQLHGNPAYRRDGRRTVLGGLGLRERFSVPTEAIRYGFHFKRRERRRLNNVMRRYGPFLWTFDLDATANDGRTDHATVRIRMTPQPQRRRSPRRPACDPSYPTVCIRAYPPDLDCADVPYRNFRVIGSDPHGFDSDGDGVGCET